MIFVSNFNISRDLSDLKGFFDKYKGTNIDLLLDDFTEGKTHWSVPKAALPGDIIIFMCAKEARHNLGMATSHIPAGYSTAFGLFVDEQKTLYKKYSGHILGYGIVKTTPEEEDGWWMADIDKLCKFDSSVYIDEFRSFISISKTNSITQIDDEQWERLKWLVHQYNPNLFQDATPPDARLIQKEYDEAVRKASLKSESQLKKEALKKKNQASVSTVQTQVYYRDPVIAAYVKQRAKGFCQLCGSKAPFADQNGNPYLECHHIEWLSKGGMDSIDNCVALCPNCHRKMHIQNDAKDINKLKSVIQE